jgi:hypothetical protein
MKTANKYTDLTLGVPTTTDLPGLNETLTQLATEVRKQRETEAECFHRKMLLPQVAKLPVQVGANESVLQRYAAPQHRAALAMLRRPHPKKS